MPKKVIFGKNRKGIWVKMQNGKVIKEFSPGYKPKAIRNFIESNPNKKRKTR